MSQLRWSGFKLKDAAEATIREFEKSRSKDQASDLEMRKTDALLKQANEEISQLQKGIDDKRLNADTFFDGNSNLDGPGKNRILDFASELDALRSEFSYVRYLTNVPNELLTIILVVCMGTLGSTIYLIQIYFSAMSSTTLSFLMFRQLLGALVALALFVLLKAGVLAAADPRSLAQSGVDLNPFMIAFLAIVGGLLSEQAIDKIKHYGDQWLAQRGTRSRYARGIRAEIETQHKSADDLARVIGVQKEAVDLWLIEEEGDSVRTQLVVAAWLNKPVRELFSDMPATATTAERQRS